MCAGCVSGTYLRPVVAGAEYSGVKCTEPGYRASFPLDAIYISLSIDLKNPPNHGVELILSIPEGQIAQLTERTLDVHTKTPNGEKRDVIEFRQPYWASGIGNSILVPLTGSTHIVKPLLAKTFTRYRMYPLVAEMSFDNVESGSVKLPNMIINGKEVIGPDVPFVRTGYSLLPIECE